MILESSDLIDFSQGFGIFALAVFLRVGMIVALFPGFGESFVSIRIKVAIALVLTTVVAVTYYNPSMVYPNLPFLILSELASGLILGVGVRLFILALQTAGTIAAQATSLSQILGAAGVDPMPAIGHVLVIGAICLSVILGLHVQIIELLVISFEFLPVGVFSDGANVAQWGQARVSKAFSLAFGLAMPFVILSILYNLVLGIVNRAMPQLMVAFVGAPFITFGGLFFLFLTAGLMINVWVKELGGFLINPLR
jgi:flagellar biosynthetic protein FliR